MAFDFTGIVKRRVPFVPYVQPHKNSGRSNENTHSNAGQAARLPLSTLSNSAEVGQAGQSGTRITLAGMRKASRCYIDYIVDAGHAGQAGHVMTQDDVEYFDERAGILEFDGQLHRADAEVKGIR